MRVLVRQTLQFIFVVLTFGVVVRAYQGGSEITGYHVCCDINTTDALCFNTCMEALSDPSTSEITSLQLQAMSSACSPLYTSFWTCVDVEVNVTSEIPPTQPPMSPYYHCCSVEGISERCRTACQMHLATDQEFISQLSLACRSVVSIPQSPVWPCLLSPLPTETSTTNPNDIGDQPPHADWARVQCCNRAYDQECRESCLDLYTGRLLSSDSWSTFQLDCIHRPSESRLSTCMADVSSPCKLGCTGPHPQDQLAFCTNFNNRPSESFRQCNNAADRMAKNSFYNWIRTGVVQHPLRTLYVSNLEGCLPEMWKAVACITHIQPCHPTTHITQICRKDCIQLLSNCSKSDVAPQAVCDIIAPANTEKYCISISDYLKPSPISYKAALVIENPCDPNPCAEGYFCAINHKCQVSEQGCTSFSCQPGCIIGDRPSFVVPEDSGVRVNLITNSDRRCYGYFNCSIVRQGAAGRPRGTDESPAAIGGTALSQGFQPVHNHCEGGSTCMVDGAVKAHGSRFHKDCNFCICSHGREICTNRQCFGGQPTYNCSECSMDFSPICTMDGRTLPNSCFAKCMGYGRGEYLSDQDCRASNPCATGFRGSSRCATGESCIPTRKICFSNSSIYVECKQYTCVNQDNCNAYSNPVCDNSESSHTSLCSFLRTHSNLDYLGYCKPECSRSRSKQVCGVNGENFPTECHSDSDYVAMDYYGHCKSIPQSGSDGKSCPGVTCPALPYAGCVGVTPWDACCPKCGGYITVLMDTEIMLRNTHALGLESLSSIDIIKRLRYHISSLQCNLYGHYSLDGSLSLLVLPTLNSSLDLLIGTCNQEAVKLATFINNQTPMLASDPYLSHMVAATVQTATLKEVPITVSTEKLAPNPGYSAAQPLASFDLVLVTILMLLQVVFVHSTMR